MDISPSPGATSANRRAASLFGATARNLLSTRESTPTGFGNRATPTLANRRAASPLGATARNLHSRMDLENRATNRATETF